MWKYSSPKIFWDLAGILAKFEDRDRKPLVCPSMLFRSDLDLPPPRL